MSHYPVVFVHGYIGWGEEDGLSHVLGYWGQGENNILKHLESRGVEVHAPSLGPYTSAWDRSCELWAYLFGGRVDYGKVHSAKHGHARYGRVYEHGAIEDLGKIEAHKKINIIGHSFGGPTVKVFVELMCRGFQEEIDGTDPDDLSPLFAGGHGNLIHTCTTLSGVNNGTTFDMLSRPSIWLATVFVLSMAATWGNVFSRFRDVGLEHYGIGQYPGKHLHGFAWFRSLRGILKYAANRWDTATYEMAIPFAHDLNEGQATNPHIYYFAHSADCSKKFAGNLRVPDRHLTSRACRPSSLLMGLFLPPKFRGDRTGYHVDAKWYPNDGFVNTIAQRAPFNAPQTEGEFGMSFKPGVWYNMPVVHGDHLWWNGIEVPQKELFDYYDAMIDTMNSLPDT